MAYKRGLDLGVDSLRVKVCRVLPPSGVDHGGIRTRGAPTGYGSTRKIFRHIVVFSYYFLEMQRKLSRKRRALLTTFVTKSRLDSHRKPSGGGSPHIERMRVLVVQ